MLLSSVDGHVTGVVFTFLALNVSQSEKGSSSVASCIDTIATLPSLYDVNPRYIAMALCLREECDFIATGVRSRVLEY